MMQKRALVTIFLTSLASTILCFTEDELKQFDKGLSEYFKSGVPPTYFSDLLHKNQLPNLLREDERDSYNAPTVCYLCNSVVDLVILERRAGLSRESLFEEVSYLCVHLGIENERVCKGVIDFNIDVALYVIDNYANFTSNRVCGSVLQSFGCEAGDAFEWSIEIAEGASPERPPIGDAGSFKILHVTDIHYDPEYTPNGNAACGEPLCCQKDQGEAPSPEEACGYWTTPNADSPWHLVEETVRQAKTQDFDYVYYTGDTVSHLVWDTSIEKNTRALTQLNTYFKESFTVPVFPIFGNHDPHPLNLWPPEDVQDELFNLKWLFELAAQQWSELIGEDVSETVLKGGYYSVSPKPGFRVIGINNNVGYVDNFWLIYEDKDPFNQLQWLADTLKLAEDNGESVHILAHCPTGSSSSLKVWHREYGRIVERFANTITGQFYGHSHHDEFHIFYDRSNSSKPISVAFNGASTTASITSFGNANPSFRYYTVEDNTFTLLDSEEWIFNLTLANSQPIDQSPEWFKLYSFVDAYGIESLLPSEVDKAVLKMTSDHSLLDDYYKFRFRNVEANDCDDSCKRDLLCNIVTTLYGRTEQCDYYTGLYNTSG